MILRPWAASAAPVARNVTRGPWRAHDSSVAQRVGTRGYSSAPTLGGQPLGMEAPWGTRTPTAVRVAPALPPLSLYKVGGIGINYKERYRVVAYYTV